MQVTMAAMSHTPTTEATTSEEQARFPLLAVGSAFATSAAFIGVGIITRDQGGHAMATGFGSVASGLAALFLIPGWTRLFALMMTWNALGIAAGLFAVGLLTVGAIMVLPLVLVVFTLASWPETMPLRWSSPAALIAIAGGAALVILIASLDGDLWPRLTSLVGA
jgi:hypothetical protein